MRKSGITVTLASPSATNARRLLAQNFSVLFARGRCKVALLDTGEPGAFLRWGSERARAGLRPSVAIVHARQDAMITELDRLRARYDHMLIDTDLANAHESRCALVAAHVALVAVGRFDCLAPLVDRLNSARMFNPGLRVCCIPVTGETGPDRSELQRVREFAAATGTLHVANTALHMPALTWGASIPGMCACDLESSAGADEMASLFSEIFPTPTNPSRSHGWRTFFA